MYFPSELHGFDARSVYASSLRKTFFFVKIKEVIIHVLIKD